jgi:DcuC family C4-dicarboxylate transporter
MEMDPTWPGLVIIAAAIAAIIAKVDVRLALLLAALALASIAGEHGLALVMRTFFVTLTSGQFIVPICCAMGFAHVLKQTRCDQHLVNLLLQPMRRVRGLLIPGTVLVGFLVNLPIVSQTSTAVAIGSVAVPLLQAARLSPVTIGAALLLGCSIGGELLNPAAPEFRTVSAALDLDDTRRCVEQVAPLIFPHLALATLFFWVLSLRAERRASAEKELSKEDMERSAPSVRVNLVKALVPLLPITLLFLAGPPINAFKVPTHWLADVNNSADVVQAESRLIGAAMLVGVASAALTAGRTALGTARSFFEGAGFAYTHIISVIVAAACFGKGVEAIGLAQRLGDWMTHWPSALIPVAGGLPLAFGWVSGSGMASTQSLYGFFVQPAQSLGADPVHIGAVVSIGAAAGRTMSPVAAVTLMCATLTGTNPFDLIRRLALPVLAGMILVVFLASRH